MSKSKTNSAASAIRYTINLHDTLTQEKHMNNGKEYQYFVVVKNVPFIIVISSKGEAPANFKKNTISASLLYDCEPRREVSLIRSTPLEYVTHISSNGEEITIEARIHVLTSQQEDSLFRVCVSFNDQEVTSDPLKVISKADNVRKAPKNSSSPSPTPATIKKKRTANDAFGETLLRIEQQQQEQRKLIDMLCKQNELLMNQLKQANDNAVPSPSCSNPPSPVDTCTTSDIETAFSSFINCYASLSPVERPHKVRALQKTVHQSKTLIVDFTNNFLTQQPTLLDEVLGIDDDMFGCDIEAELAHFVPSSPTSIPSPSESPLSSPERSSDSLDGYWSRTFSETNSPLNDCFDIDSELTDNFISELLCTSTDCTSIC